MNSGIDIVELKAHAKINWMLNVMHKRSDGYHELQTVMAPVSLSDEVIIERAGELKLSCSGLPCDESNTAMKAVLAYAKRCGYIPPVHISIKKHIPLDSGLGGGSADAAAVLRGLNALYGGLTKAQLFDAARESGADVPACLLGRACYATGIGEKLTPIESVPFHLLLAKPETGVSTGRLFSTLSLADIRRVDPQGTITALRNGDLRLLARSAGNSLLESACRHNRDIAPLLQSLLNAGAIGVNMSGSGSCCYGVFESAEAASRAHGLIHSPFKVVCRSF